LNRSTRPLAAALLALGASAAHVLTAAAQDDAKFEFSGTQRTRYESLDPQYRAGFSNSDQALALQTTVALDWQRGSIQAFGEIMDSRTELNDSGSFATNATTNTLEPVQAYVAFRRGGGTLRVGRATQDLGKRRLLARNRYRNTVSTFTGIDWAWDGENGRSWRVFYWLPMRGLPSDAAGVLDNDEQLDRAVRDSSIKGLFHQFPLLAGGHRVEAYLFDYELDPTNDPASAADHVTFGTRVYRAPQAGEWNYEVEGVLQRGESGSIVAGVARNDLGHRASFLHAEIGYQFDKPWTPNLLFQYDRASGDKDPGDARVERFNTLFGARRFDFGPTGIYGVAARSNIDSPGVRLTFRPAERWQAMLSYRSLRLVAQRDAWAGSGWRDPSGGAGKSIGRHLEGSFTWSAIPDRLSVETGFAHLSAGRFAEQTAGAAFRGDPQYVYAAVITTF
jgi:hypothetical protein